MPPKRKALDTADANVDKPNNAAAKKAKPSTAAETSTATDQAALIKEVTDRRSKRWAAVSNSKNIDREFYELITKDPNRSYTFMCVCNPLVDDDEEEEGEEEDDDEHSSVIDEWSEDEHCSDPEDKPQKKKKLPKSGPCDGGKTCPCTKTSAELPDYPFTFTRAGIGRHHAASDMMDMRNPDAMGMYTFNDHMAYGALEVVQNMMLDFDEAYQGNRLLELWSVLEGIALFVAKGEGELMSMADDGARIQETVEQLARMMLTGLAALEAENKLKEIKNVGLVIAFFLQLGETWQEMSLLGESAPSKAKTFKFIPEKLDRYLHAIAKRHDIDIPGVDDLDTDDDDDEVTMPKAGKDPWGWTKAFASYCKGGPPGAALGRGSKTKIGGDALDMSSWTSAERKKSSFDKKDPLPANILKNLKQGLVLGRG